MHTGRCCALRAEGGWLHTQGKEADHVIFSCVRAQPARHGSASVGFLADVRRMNVGLTRARSANLSSGAPVSSADNSGTDRQSGMMQVSSFQASCAKACIFSQQRGLCGASCCIWACCPCQNAHEMTLDRLSAQAHFVGAGEPGDPELIPALGCLHAACQAIRLHAQRCQALLLPAQGIVIQHERYAGLLTTC